MEIIKNVTEQDLIKLFGLRTINYLPNICHVKFIWCSKTNTYRGFAYLTGPAYILNELVKLSEIEFTLKIPQHRTWNVPANFVFSRIIDYIYHHIACDTTGKVTREVGEIERRGCFSYCVSWRVNLKTFLQNVRTITVKRYSDWFGFLKFSATCLNQWQAIAIKHTTPI